MRRLPILLSLWLLAPLALAQAPPSTPAITTDDGPPGVIPVRKGYNLSILTSSQHDSSNGWTSIFTPDGAYRINRNFSVDVGTPIYDYINILVTGGTIARPTYTEKTSHLTPGDTALNGHVQFAPTLFSYELTATLGLATGDRSYGLGAGQTTYAINNSFERSFGFISPSIEIGIGDSSSLDQTRIRKSYTSVGTLADFQAGAAFDLPYNLSFSASAYENLPVAAQTLYSTTGKGRKKVTTATGKSVAEDNGFQTSLDIPLTAHVTLSGFYNRSLRSKIDTAGFSFLFLLKGHPKDAVH